VVENVLSGYPALVTDSGEESVDVVPRGGGTDGNDVSLRQRHPFLLGLVVALVAVNLRPAVASVGPVLPEMRADVPLSGTGAAVLTFLPVLCFGVLAGVAPRLARRLGIEPVLLAVMAAVAVGLAVRVLDGPVLLFAGTVVVGGAIALGTVLVPPLVKRDFPNRVGLMMGVYTMAVSGSAAAAAGLTVPLGDAIGLGWRGALAVWFVPAVLAAVAWLPRVSAHTRAAQPPAGRSLRRSSLAWQVTIYFGLQSLSFYAVLAWLPSIYREYGFGAAEAGVLLSVSGLVQVPVALLLPALASRAANQVGYIVFSTLLIGMGLTGVLLAPTAAPYLWVVLIGVGQGGAFALGLNLFVLRTRRVADTARLSAMAQSIGYVICAFGPLLMGVLHDATGSWTPPLVLLLVLIVPQLVFGAISGRARTLG
jgi:CP family cyanate transporter-like MFS transporter